MKAAGVHRTHRRRSTNMARADRTGLRVRATLKVATAPKSQVTGASTTPMPTSAVLDSRLTPAGWNIAVEYSGSSPWEKAYAGQARNQVNNEESPQPQVVVDVGWFDQTCHHSITDR